jgi:NAD-dependent dihydropyrimidine dehydrogenase PreA subunit
MAHQHAVRSGYSNLVERLNKFPQGAPPSELLHKILALLFSEREAGLVARLPIRPFSASKAARAWSMPEVEARKILETLASRAVLLDIEQNGEMAYVLPPPMAGFFEFSMMRVRDDVDQRALAELFFQYLNVEEDFIKALFCHGETQLGRVFVHESALEAEKSLQVLDYERASWVIGTATAIGVGICYCRHKMHHVHRACDAPMNICMTFNNTADSLIRHGFARRIDAGECRDLLDQARGRKLVQFGENVQRKVNFICNCCGCCCEALIAARRFGMLHPVHTTHFLPHLISEKCEGCGKCMEACPVEALKLVSANNPQRQRKRIAILDAQLCLGCGVCIGSCSKGALRLEQRPERVITPVDSVHKTVLMAIERGKLQNLIFDNQALASHRAMAAVLGVILKLPPIRQGLASHQLKSRYLESLIARC